MKDYVYIRSCLLDTLSWRTYSLLVSNKYLKIFRLISVYTKHDVLVLLSHGDDDIFLPFILLDVKSYNI